MDWRRALAALLLTGIASGPGILGGSAPGAAGSAPNSLVSYRAAKPVLDALPDNLPKELRAKSRAQIEAAWPAWAARRDADIRARLARGDEDSIVNFWLYGTTFTKLARAVDRDLATAPGRSRISDVVRRRLDELIDAMASPRVDERLEFAREVLARHGIDAAPERGKETARRALTAWRQRAIGEHARYDRALELAQQTETTRGMAAYSTIFRDRGLSSDTSLLPDFGVAQALAAMKAQGTLRPGAVGRVAVIGPGLDFSNKADGYDFYPLQTIQPFALVDSLIRLGLSPPDLRVTTFDLSPRVNRHLASARQRAGAGIAYVVQLPLNADERWSDQLLAYWERLGKQIGQPVEAAPAPPGAGHVRVRAVGVRPAVVLAVEPRDVNIVVERPEIADADRFDLIVATNTLVYYDLFEQALALANAASMLRPEGVVLLNNAVFPTRPLKSSAGFLQVLWSDRRHDDLFWYQRE